MDATKPQAFIHIHKARENNLKDVEVDIPIGKLTVVTGLSGSGKSSLVMDVLHGEAQRKFAESMTSYARQFLANAKKPDVDYISHLCPSIAIRQHKSSAGQRSTVGTVTEVYDYLRLLYARVGKMISPITGKEFKCYQPADIAEEIIRTFLGEKIFIYFSLEVAASSTKRKEQIDILLRKGFTRMYLPSTRSVVSIEEEEHILPLLQNHEKEWYILVDRVLVEETEDTKHRLVDSIQVALFEGHHTMSIATEQGASKTYTTLLEEEGISYIVPQPNLFSFNNSYGICPACEGYGTLLDVDPKLVIPRPSLSLYDGAVAPWKGEKMSNYRWHFIEQSSPYGFPIHRPIEQLSKQEMHLLWHGNGKDVQGIYDFFDEVKRNTYKIQYRVLLSRYQGKTICRSCNGFRLRKEALYVQWQGKHIGEAARLSVEELLAWMQQSALSVAEEKIVGRIRTEVVHRLETLTKLGLSYLSLDRTINTLSGGESQRVQLAKFIGSTLTDSLYLLDEPSIGLHPKDTQHLIGVLQELRDLGNTVVVVEHDESIIRQADYIVDMGPKAGTEGGQVVAMGALDTILRSDSLTANYLNKQRRIERKKRSSFFEYLSLKEASLFNIEHASLEIPTGALTVVHGPSGSGKSTLINRILYPAICKALSVPLESKEYGHGEWVHFPKSIQAVEWVSQESIGAMSRSNPISYIEAYDPLRKLFAMQEESKKRFLTASSFSFNSPGGRCEQCKGEGKKIIEMQFLPPVELTCEECKGKRFTEEVLAVRIHGLNIDDVLQLTVDEAVRFFGTSAILKKKLEALAKVGLGYVHLGQSTSTLSGGELQRLKLASFLTRQRPMPTLFFFDEPTVGLHFHDVDQLKTIFDELIREGHSVVVIEHNTDMLACADWWVELGPGSGKHGGKVVYCGVAKADNR